MEFIQNIFNAIIEVITKYFYYRSYKIFNFYIKNNDKVDRCKISYIKMYNSSLEINHINIPYKYIIDFRVTGSLIYIKIFGNINDNKVNIDLDYGFVEILFYCSVSTLLKKNNKNNFLLWQQ